MGAPQYEQAGADVAGTGTTNTIPRWTGASTLGNSGLIDDGTQVYTTTRNVGIGTASPTATSTIYKANNSLGAWNAQDLSVDGLSNGDAVYQRWYATGVAGAVGRFGVSFQSSVASFVWNSLFNSGVQTAELMRLTGGGYLGIGTTNPGGRLDVVGAAASLGWAIRAQVNSTNTSPALNAELGLNLKNTSSTVGNYTSITNRDSADNANTQINFINVNNSGSGAINFVTRDSAGGPAAERARIDSSGNVGIGTTSPTAGRALTTVADLDVYGVRVGRGTAGLSTNTAVGSGTLGAVTTAPNATAVGVNALAALTTGTNNTAVGLGAASAVTTSYNNTAIGVSALGAATTNAGFQNVAVGVSALAAATSAKNNVAIGVSAGSTLTSGSSNIIIGSGASVAAVTDSNQLVLGDATNYIATNGGATTYYATAGASLGYIQVRLNGANVKIQVFAP